MDQAATQMAQRHQNERNLQTHLKTTISKAFLSVSEVQLKKHLLQIARNLRPQVSWCRQEAEKRCEISMERTGCGTASPSNVSSMGKSERFFDAKKKWTVDHIQQARWVPGKNSQCQRYCRGPTINKALHSTGLREEFMLKFGDLRY